MDHSAEYRAKLTTARDAIRRIPECGTVVMGMAVSEPPALLEALAERARERTIADLRLYYYESMEHARRTVLRYELLDRIKPHCMFFGRFERELCQWAAAEGRKLVQYVPNSFSQSARFLTECVEPDAFLATVSPMDKAGFFTFGTNNDYGSTVARHCKHLIVEVNDQMPRVFGQSLLHVSEVGAVVENHAPLIELSPRPTGPEGEAIGRRVMELVPDGAVLQMGVGEVPDAVCQFLGSHKDLGIHTEILTPGMVDLIEKGVVTNRTKKLNPQKTVCTFTMGDRRLYDFIHDNPGVETYPVSYVNDPAVIAANDKVISICSTLEIDLTGQCNSEHLLGHQYTGTGGQLDFVRGAYASRGGKSIIAFHATAGGGQFSRVVPRLSGPATVPRVDTHIVVTEYGSFDLKGKSSAERALGLIGLAHPRFRAQLHGEARKLHLL